MSKQTFKVRPQIVNVNSNESAFFPFIIWTGKSVVVVTISMIPDVAKKLSVRVFNLISTPNETRPTNWHETCKCKCRLDASVCNNKQMWN